MKEGRKLLRAEVQGVSEGVMTGGRKGREGGGRKDADVGREGLIERRRKEEGREQSKGRRMLGEDMREASLKETRKEGMRECGGR